jgi:acetylornithine deacetylase/succinyl-diaminopimelate desuccinylase-like protein
MHKELVRFLQDNHQRYLAEVGELISIPSVSTDPARKTDVQRCAEWLAGRLCAAGLNGVQIIPTGGHPVVYGEWIGNPGPTLLVYGHYDVQPPEPIEQWTSPPFQATVRDGRLNGRGTADDKGQLYLHVKAAEAFLRCRGHLPVNIKMLFEGEEETGSPHLEAFLQEHRDLLRADLAVISDTSFFSREIPSICYGLRGIAMVQIEARAGKHDLHSGVYGGAVPNPIQALSKILAGLHDENGRVTIPGFYEDVRPLDRCERQELASLPWDDQTYAECLGVRDLCGEAGFTTIERLWLRPTLECNGISGGYQGAGFKSVLPAVASAKLSMRLVPDQDPARIADLLARYVHAIAPKTVHVSVHYVGGARAAVTPIHTAGIQAAAAALEHGFGKKPRFTRDGGTLPVLAYLKDLLGIDAVLLGFGVPDENAHAPNEFIYLDHFFNGLQTVAEFYDQLAQRWMTISAGGVSSRY